MTDAFDFRDLLGRVLDGHPLTREQIGEAFGLMMNGKIEAIPMTAFLVALRVKGETSDEIAAAAQTMRRLAPAVDTGNAPLVDTCGTGGTGKNIFNVSSASAIVAAAAGVRVAKHGNRAASSSSGSADALERLGIAIDLDAHGVTECLEEIGIAFLFARRFHSAMRHVAPVRQALGTRTIFNLLGPLTNPARPSAQVIGVFDERWQKPLARVTHDLGITHALVVHAEDGSDEISISSPTFIVEQREGVLKERTIAPRDFGITETTSDTLRVSGAKESAELITRLLAGEPGAAYDMTVLNAAAAIYVGGKASNITEGVAKARAAIDGGAARKLLQRWIRISQKCKRSGKNDGEEDK